MKLPHGAHAVIEVAKLRDYCLSLTHLQGRDKARVFRSALGLTQADAEVLRAAIFQAVHTEAATAGIADEYGTRYTVDFEMVHGSRRAFVRTAWIIRVGDEIPRLTTCYVR